MSARSEERPSSPELSAAPHDDIQAMIQAMRRVSVALKGNHAGAKAKHQGIKSRGGQFKQGTLVDEEVTSFSSVSKSTCPDEYDNGSVSKSSKATSKPDSEIDDLKEKGESISDCKNIDESTAQGCVLRRSALCLGVCFCLVMVWIPLGVGIYYWTDKDAIQPFAQCGDCHCSYADSDHLESCPEKPLTEFSEEYLNSLLALKPIYELPKLECDPYQDGECQTQFLFFDNDSETVCAIHLMEGPGSGTCDSYWMVSYGSAQAAIAAGGHVTHRGACGLCSSLQDLVVYMRHRDLTTLGQDCGVRGLAVRDNGVECFQNKLGMTEGCAAIWMANVRSTLHNCGGICFKEDFLNKDFNGPSPTCELSECLQCDEDNSGDVFKAFAGRTRRRSGLISAIARPCETIATEIRHDLPTTCLSWG